MSEIQCSYVLPDGTRYEFIRADEAVFRLQEDGLIHADATKGRAWRPDLDARAGKVAGRSVIWRVERFGADGKVTLLSERRMKLSPYGGEFFTLTPE